MEKIPTAKKVYYTVTGCVLESHHNPDIEKAMVKFAKLHVKAALKEVSEKMYSEEEVYNLLCQFPNKEELDNWFEQNKKK